MLYVNRQCQRVGRSCKRRRLGNEFFAVAAGKPPSQGRCPACLLCRRRQSREERKCQSCQSARTGEKRWCQDYRHRRPGRRLYCASCGCRGGDSNNRRRHSNSPRGEFPGRGLAYDCLRSAIEGERDEVGVNKVIQYWTFSTVKSPVKET